MAAFLAGKLEREKNGRFGKAWHFFETVLGGGHSGKFKKKLIGYFNFWGIILKVIFKEKKEVAVCLKLKLKLAESQLKSILLIFFFGWYTSTVTQNAPHTKLQNSKYIGAYNREKRK